MVNPIDIFQIPTCFLTVIFNFLFNFLTLGLKSGSSSSDSLTNLESFAHSSSEAAGTSFFTFFSAFRKRTESAACCSLNYTKNSKINKIIGEFKCIHLYLKKTSLQFLQVRKIKRIKVGKK